jgi:murein DD-endopeptidase MepM/ murein hydrolase activator NlpD
MPIDTPAAFTTRRERLAHERARSRRRRSRPNPTTPRARHPHRPAHVILAAVSALGLLGVAAVPVLATAGAPAEASTVVAAKGAAQEQTAHGRGSTSVSRDDDGYTAQEPQALVSSSETGDERVLDLGQLLDQPWDLPVAGPITSPFGPRPDHPVAGTRDFHAGTDLGAACGTPIHAATAGTVVEAKPDGSYGNWVLIEHGDGIQTGYAHIMNGGTEVTVGQNVEAGQEIARVGATGAATGCHLHFEVHIGGKAVDAVPFMAKRGITLG